MIRLTMPTMADFGFFDVVEAKGEVRRIAYAYEDPRRQAILETTRWMRSERTDINLCGLSTGQSGLHPTIDDAWLQDVAVAPPHLDLMRDLAFGSMATVPLIYQGRVLGALTLFYADSGRRYTADDLTLIEELARRAAAAVENARLFKEAQRAIQTRDEFLSVASHELRTPLTTLQAHAQLMLRRFSREGLLDPARTLRAFEAINEQANRLAQLIAQLLDISRIEAGRLALNRQPADLVRLARDAIDAARVIAPGYHFALHAPVELTADVDPLRLEQVLTNLLDNAIKYSPDGGRIEVEIRDGVEIVVRDHGIGIAPEQRERIFERFYQAQANGHAGGMGLGLHISRQIVELHGGELRVESPEDGGARFVVRLPAKAIPVR